jgi:hypothetical protein
MMSRKIMFGVAALLLAAISLNVLAADEPTAEKSSPVATPAAEATPAEKSSPAATPATEPTTAEKSSPAITPAAEATTAEKPSPEITSAAEATAASKSAPAATSAAEALTAEKPLPAATSGAAAPAAGNTPPQTKLALLVAAVRAQGKIPAKESFDKYQVIVANNIFVRVHPRVTPTREYAPSPIATALSPEEATVLRGVVRQGEGPDATYFVFLEDIQSHETTRMPVGELVCMGKLVNPTLDSVDYVKNGVTTRITVGQNLTGAEATPVFAAPASAFSATAPTTPVGGAGAAEAAGNSATASPSSPSPGAGANSAAATPPASLDTIAEQMRQKRLKDLGK